MKYISFVSIVLLSCLSLSIGQPTSIITNPPSLLPTQSPSTTTPPNTPTSSSSLFTSTLDATGSAYVYIPSTVVDISVKVTSKTKFSTPITDTTAQAKDIQDAIQTVQSQVAYNTNNLVSYLKTNYTNSLTKLKTSNIQLKPEYTYDSTTTKTSMTGYLSMVTVSFRLPMSVTNRIISDILSSGASEINSILYTATEKEISQARMNAVELATLDAITQAESMIKSFNNKGSSSFHSLTIVKSSVVYLTTPIGETGSPLYYASNSDSMVSAPPSSSSSSSTQLEGADQLIRATVNVSFGAKN